MRIFRILLPALLCCSPALALAQEPANADSVFDLTVVDTRPLPLNVSEFEAALLARVGDRRSARSDVTVHTRFVVGADGILRNIENVRSTNRAFDSTALSALAILRFTPATVNGRPVAVRVDLPLRWRPPTSPPRPDAYGCVGDSARANTGPVPIYSMNIIYHLGEMPRPTNMAELPGELQRLYPGVRSQGAREADVNVEMVVNEEGAVVGSQVVRTTDARFNEATREGVRILRFVPARILGTPVRTCIEIPILWRPQ